MSASSKIALTIWMPACSALLLPTTHEAVAGPGGLPVRVAAPEKAAMTEFLMLKDGLVGFEGAADELRHSDDPYVKAFLS